MGKIQLIVNDDNINERIDVFLSNNTNFSRTNIQNLIKDNRILVNGVNTSKKYLLKENDLIDVDFDDVTTTEIVAKDIPLDIIYEDDDLIVINKQKGLVVHPAPGNYDNTLVNGLIYHFNSLSDINGNLRPGIVHRIDKDTSGLLVVCKNNDAHLKIAEQLNNKECFRKYYAVVDGIIENDEGVINAPIGRSKKDRQKMEVTDVNSKEAISEFKVLNRFSKYTLVDVKLLTGRTHQIRVHFKFINHSVVNDPKYNKKTIDDKGQYLHAYYLSFIHPRTNKRVEFISKMPNYMKEFIINNGGNINE